MLEVKLPQLSEEEDVESLVVYWNKSEGEPIKKGDVLVEVQTEKAVSEIEAEEDGVLTTILVQRGESAKVGDILAVIATETELNKKENTSNPDANTMQQELEPGPLVEGEANQQFVRVSPRLRKLARELGVDLATVSGTGRNGQPTEEDIRQAAKPLQSDYKKIPITGVRKTIANRMAKSLQSTAQLTITSWANVSLLDEERKRLPAGVSWNDLILFAAVKALVNHPHVNAHVFEEEIHRYERVHLGIAVDTEDGLFVPVIKNAHQLALSELKEQAGRMVDQARQHKLTAEELSGATFTVTNLGGFGVQFFTPILNEPEAAILGLGKIETDAVLVDGKLAERKRLPLSLTFDHRALDGAPAAKFLQEIVSLLEVPAALLEDVLIK